MSRNRKLKKKKEKKTEHSLFSEPVYRLLFQVSLSILRNEFVVENK